MPTRRGIVLMACRHLGHSPLAFGRPPVAAGRPVLDTSCDPVRRSPPDPFVESNISLHGRRSERPQRRAKKGRHEGRPIDQLSPAMSSRLLLRRPSGFVRRCVLAPSRLTTWAFWISRPLPAIRAGAGVSLSLGLISIFSVTQLPRPLGGVMTTQTICLISNRRE